MNTFKGINNDNKSVLIIYDVTDDKRRYKVVKILEGYGNRVQESAFECCLMQYKLFELKRRLIKVIEKEDSIRIYQIGDTCFDVWRNSEIPTVTSDVYII